MVLQAKKGVLLIHGLTGTPYELSSLKKKLEENGFYCESPIVAGHCSFIEDLENKKWEEWHLSVENSFMLMADLFSEIYIAGLSLGSLLALNLARTHSNKIKALALFSSPFVLKNKKTRALPFIIYSPLRFFYRYKRKNGAGIIDNEAKMKHRGYDKIPVKSIMELVKLQKSVLRKLGGINTPVLICHSEKDESADISGSRILYEKIGSNVKKFVKLYNSGHIITEDYEKEVVEKEVIDFFKSN